MVKLLRLACAGPIAERREPSRRETVQSGSFAWCANLKTTARSLCKASFGKMQLSSRSALVSAPSQSATCLYNGTLSAFSSSVPSCSPNCNLSVQACYAKYPLATPARQLQPFSTNSKRRTGGAPKVLQCSRHRGGKPKCPPGFPRSLRRTSVDVLLNS